jgi:hypothetical protein
LQKFSFHISCKVKRAVDQTILICQFDYFKLFSSGESGKKKVKYVYKSADQVLEEGKWRKVSAGPSNSAQSKVRKIFFSRGFTYPGKRKGLFLITSNLIHVADLKVKLEPDAQTV